MVRTNTLQQYSSKWLKIAAICIFMLAVQTVRAQRYHFHNLSVEDGLIQSQATCLAQDKTGNLWIGTLGGLSRYDGRNFTNFTVRNGLLHNIIRAIATDNSGNVWIGGLEGLSRFDGKSFKHYRRQVQVTRNLNNTQQIMMRNDTAWWRVQGDVYYVADGNIKYFPTPDGAGFVTALMVGDDGLWLAKGGNIYHYQNNKWETLQFRGDGTGETPVIHHIFRTGNGTIWLSGGLGLYKVSGRTIVAHRVEGEPLTLLTGITSGAEDNNGTLWLGTTTGAVRVDSSGTQYYNRRNGLTDNSVNDILRDAEGSIWMATDGQGLFRFSGTQFTGLDESFGLPSAQVMAIAYNGADSLFIGTYDAGLYVYKDRKVSPLFFPSNPVPPVTSLCYTSYSGLWIGTRGRGLWNYDNGIFKQYITPERDFLSNYVNSLYVDTFNRLWIGFTNGVMVLEEGIFKIADTNNSPVYSFLTIGFDSTLIATEGGLRLFHAGSSAPFVTRSIIDSSAIQCFIVRGRELWLGSSDNGVIRYNMDTQKCAVINKGNGLRSDFIYNIVSDNDGNVWVGTGFGIHKIAIREHGDPVVTFYGKAQGIMGMESNINSVLKLPDGSIWFGTTNGALHYNPHRTAVASAPSQIVLQSVKIAGETVIDPRWYDKADNWYGIPYDLHLPYKKNNIAFTFQAITLSGAQQALYRYRVDGLDAPWSDWSTTNSVTYSALPPGNYVFKVQCRSEAGTSAPELSYPFEIITPFQKTAWFRFAVLVACLALGYFIQYSINHKKERQQTMMAKLRAEEQGKIRTRTAEDFHDEIGNKLTRINVLTNVLKNKVPLTPETARILGQIEDNTSQLYGGTRDILWSLRPSNDVLYEILYRIRDFGTELFQDTEISFTFSGSDSQWHMFRLNMEMSRNLIMIFKEALNNTLKYAEAKNVSLEVTLKQKNLLQMVLKDDGVGFDVHTAKKGNGMANMQTRAGRLNGKLYVDSRPGKGTIISLTFKIPQNR
jgi:ligand-binding sensor domain-containing protein/signal transduction histidine kinase